MALESFTLDDLNVFPNGTVVTLYHERDSSGAIPMGTAVQTQTMTDGSLTFTDLPRATSFVAWGFVNGVWRKTAFSTTPVPHIGLFSDEDVEITAEWAFLHRLQAGYNPSFELNPGNPRRWAVLDFVVETESGAANRLHTRSLALHQHGDPAEFLLTRSGPDNSGVYGPNGDGTGLEGVLSGASLGFITWMGLIPQGSFQGHAARIGARLLEDSRQDALTVTLTNEVTLPQSTIEVTGDLDAFVATDGTVVAWEQAGVAKLGGQTVTYAGRDADTLFGCEGGTGTHAAGTTVTQTQTRSGGTIRLQTSSLGTGDIEAKLGVDHDGSLRVGQLAIEAGSANFFTVRGGKSRFQAMPAASGLTGTVIGTPGTATYTYYVVGRTAHGASTLPATVVVSSAPDTLNDSNYIRLNWTGPNAGIVTWDVVREASTGIPATTGPIILGQPFYGGKRAFDNGKAIVSVNERQSIAVLSADGGTYTLTYDGQTTSALAFDASAATIQAALEALSNIGVGDVSVVASGVNQVVVTFTGALAGTNVSQMIPDATNLTQSEIDADPPLIDLRTRTQGGAATYTKPTRTDSADVAFDGEVSIAQILALTEQSSDPAAPGSAVGKLYTKDASGRTKLYLRDSTGVKSFLDSTEAAGGVLSGTYPNPGFAVDMASQAELDAYKVEVDGRYRVIERNAYRARAAEFTGAGVYAASNGTFIAQSGVAALTVLYIDPDDWAIAGRATKLRVVAACGVNDTAPGAITLTLGLYPVANITGGAGVSNPNFGTVVPGTTIAFASLAANSESAQTYTTDINLPAEGWYGIGLNASGAMTANSQAIFPTRVEIRNV